MMGKHHSLQRLLVKDILNLFAIKCTCQFLALCNSYAYLKLPNEIETVIRSVYNYFNNSYKRLNDLKEFQEFVNVRPLKLLQPSQTRWLSFYSVPVRVLN